MFRSLLSVLLLPVFAALSPAQDAAARDDAPHVVFLVGEREYGSERTMPAFAEHLRDTLGYRSTVLQSKGRELPDLAALDQADVLVLALRFRRATDAQIARLDRWIEAGKPTIALRTTSHAFQDRQTWFPPRFGGHYKAHAPNGQGTVARVAPSAKDHPITRDLPTSFECGYGGTYDTMPLGKGARVLLFGRTADLPSQPLAWTFREWGGARLFYTSLGSEEHLSRPAVRKLLTKAVQWSLEELPRESAFDSSPLRPLPERTPPADATVLFQNGLEGWRHYDPSTPPRAIGIDRRADTTGEAAADLTPRWWVRRQGRAIEARPGFGDLLSEQTFGAVQLSFEFRMPLAEKNAAQPLLGGVYMEGRYRIPVTAADDEWHRMQIAWRHDVGRKPVAEVRVDGGAAERTLFDEPSPYGFRSGVAGGALESLPGLRHVYEDAPELNEGAFAFVVRFKCRGDGTLVSKAPRAGDWAPGGKTLFVRGGRLVYDIGWVGALGGGPRVSKGRWHTVALTHDRDTAVLFLDGREVGRKDEFVAEDEPEMVVKIGATSPTFGGGLTKGNIARVLVFDEALGLERARAASAGQLDGLAAAIDWSSEVESNVPEPAEGAAIEAPIRFHADNAQVEYANVWVRPLGDVDHAALIAGFDQAAFERGEKLFQGMCAVCHGKDGEQVTNPLARAFSKAEFQNGRDPYALFQTLTNGYRNMPAQTWMTPEQRYDVIHYMREAFLKRQNPSQYFAVDGAWLATLPPAKPALAADLAVVGATGDEADELPARDFGPGLVCQIGRAVPTGFAMRLPGDVTLAYDLHRAASIGAWRGAFLDLASTQHYQQRGEGIGMPGDEALPWTTGWGFVFDGVERPERGPYPQPAYRFRGRFAHGRDSVLHYEVFGREVHEHPTAEVLGDQVALVHHLRIGPGAGELRLRWTEGRATLVGGLAAAPVAGGETAAVMRLLGAGITIDGNQLRIPPSSEPYVFTVVRAAAASEEEAAAFTAYVDLAAARLARDPAELLGGGERLWPETITVRGERGSDELPYTVDTIPLPDANPYGAWLRTSALDFFSDGRCAVSTLGGDVWIADGLDDDLGEVRWTRFAAGLFEPLGMKIVDDIVYVTCRDGVTRLFDRDGNGEADHYDAFHMDIDVSATFHAFNFDLQQDSQGRLSYVKSGRYTSFPTPGAIVRLSPDGEQWEYIATGFRTPNGMGILPDDSLLVSDNQGNWVPASKISRIREGGFYGVFKSNEREQPDFDRPILWLPQDVDSSSGGQLFVDDPRFGPLAGQLLHTSFGKGWVYVLELQELAGKTQASCVTLPFQFAAGIQRARVNPADGQVWVTGLSGWQGPKGGKDGCLQRLRYTGKAGTMLRGAVLTGTDTVKLVFTGPVDARAAEQARYRAEMWNYRWEARYGSAQWSVIDPEKQGHDQLEVRAAKVGEDGQSVHLQVVGLQRCDQLRIDCDLPAVVGEQTLHMTLRELPTDSRGGRR